MKNHDVNVRIIIWLLLLQHCDLTIIEKPRKENVDAYLLSTLTFPVGNEEMVDDQLPYEHLFSISILSPWFVDIENYLVD